VNDCRRAAIGGALLLVALAVLAACSSSGGRVATVPETTTTTAEPRFCHNRGRSDLEVHLAPPISDERMNQMLQVITPPTGHGTQKDFLPGLGGLTTDYGDGIVWVQYRDDGTDAQRVAALETVRSSALVGAVLECTDHPPNAGGPLPTGSTNPG
jgi:hypothetical protein